MSYRERAPPSLPFALSERPAPVIIFIILRITYYIYSYSDGSHMRMTGFGYQ